MDVSGVRVGVASEQRVHFGTERGVRAACFREELFLRLGCPAARGVEDVGNLPPAFGCHGKGRLRHLDESPADDLAARVGNRERQVAAVLELQRQRRRSGEHDGFANPADVDIPRSTGGPGARPRCPRPRSRAYKGSIAARPRRPKPRQYRSPLQAAVATYSGLSLRRDSTPPPLVWNIQPAIEPPTARLAHRTGREAAWNGQNLVFRPVIACWWPQRMRVPTRNRGLEGPRHGSPRVPSWQRGIFATMTSTKRCTLSARRTGNRPASGLSSGGRHRTPRFGPGPGRNRAFSFALAAGIAVGWSPTSRDGRFRPERRPMFGISRSALDDDRLAGWGAVAVHKGTGTNHVLHPSADARILVL